MSLPTPYYEKDGITIYHADCREILPHLPKVDLVLTDPPYGIGLEYGSYEDSKDNLQALVSDVMPMFYALAPLVALTSGVPQAWLYPCPTWVLCWYQKNACVNYSPWGFSQWQPILVYGKDPFLRDGLGCRPDVVATAIPNSGADKRLGHPCPKPTEAWKTILARLSIRESDTILDPFMGSGTTLLAARSLGRRAIGIEIEEKYCKIAVERLSQAVLPFDVRDIPTRPEQMVAEL